MPGMTESEMRMGKRWTHFFDIAMERRKVDGTTGTALTTADITAFGIWIFNDGMPPSVEITQAKSSVQVIGAALTAADAGLFSISGPRISPATFSILRSPSAAVTGAGFCFVAGQRPKSPPAMSIVGSYRPEVYHDRSSFRFFNSP